ncbi:TrmB family transcriptional regulator [Clostridium vincentii]|uniref:Sugar-specific transcriptional regulator TrmB n=1 Tax=Clostridium vincentii TaxID=52704 RepID=A0A2T0BBS2_9CLOT|nr:TrmB family transcriptional regulator [Clostridium vincentii]PRR81257.1 Sugar-specific transcriptional regulator TrmB [Clostridium vincentii]
MEAIENLMSFGLTRQEASIYMLLFEQGELNGYEVSKLTAISKSNSYNALAGLVEKGAAYIIEGSAVLYTPVSIEEFCENKIRLMKKNKAELLKSIPKRKEESDGYITVKSEKHIVDKIKNMLLQANERVYLSMSQGRLQEIIAELESLRNRGIKIVIITNSTFNLNGAIVYHTKKKPSQIRLIVDSKLVLTGEITDKSNSTCLYSSNNNLVEVFKDSLTNEIKLIQIGKDDYKNE